MKKNNIAMHYFLILLVGFYIFGCVDKNTKAREEKENSTKLLLAASKEGNYKKVKYYLKNGGSINVSNKLGFTPLIMAAKNGHTNVVKLLLKEGVKIDQLDNITKHTALMWAILGKKSDVVKILINEGANIEFEDTTRTTPLLYAVSVGSRDIVKYLLSKGADIKKKDIVDNTALIHAAGLGHKDIVELLLKNGVDIDAKDIDGDTALITARREGHSEIIDMLMTKATDKKLRNDNYRHLSPLIIYICQGLGELEIKNSLKLVKDINFANSRGMNALMIASMYSDKNVVKLLLKSGAKKDIVDKSGKSAFDYAKEFGRSDIMKILEK